MQAAAESLPRKTREIRDAILDSTRWNGFKFRDGDVVIATYGKSGTTWTQQIVGELIFRGAEPTVFASGVSPWVDARFVPLEPILERLEAQQHRRFLKTHLPLDALVCAPQVKYIYIGRDGRDTAWSMWNHHASFTNQAYEMINSVPGRVGPPLEKPVANIVQYFREWLDGGALQFCLDSSRLDAGQAGVKASESFSWRPWRLENPWSGLTTARPQNSFDTERPAFWSTLRTPRQWQRH